ncbi:hypothetical protein AALB52_18085 [Lachnospiraceae bacterium 38-14]
MKIKENRMRSFVERGNELITNGKTPEAMKLVERGLGYYTDRIMKSLSPYAKADAGLIVFVMRHLANEIERNHPGAKELAEVMEKCVVTPPLIEVEKRKKANME